MRKILIGFISLCLGMSVFGDSFKLEGIIASIDNEKTIIIDSVYGDSVVVQVLPNTEIELDNCGVFGISKYGTFKNLSLGAFVEVKLYFQNAANGERTNPIAYEIEVECYKKRAY